jgi:hypothetical protein
MPKRLLVFPLLVAALALTGCEIDDWGSSDRFKEDFSYNYPLKSGGRLFLETFNGSVEVMGWDKEAVDITGTKYASTPELLGRLKIDIVSEPDSIRIRTIRPSEIRGGAGARYTVRLPRRVILERVESSNGGVRVEGIEGSARVRTSNGSINVWNVRGDFDGITSNASVDLGQFTGAATLKSSNGRIKADGVRGFFGAHTSNASIDATLGELDPARPLRLITSNGNVSLTLDSYRGNEVEVRTSNSSINLRLPSGANAQLRAVTSNGSVSCDFPLDNAITGKARLEGTVGSGGPLVDLTSSNGNIRVYRR